jgi:hypothetical protein
MPWTEEIERVDRRGTVYVRLHNGERSMRMRVSAPGANERVLARSRFGDVSYSGTTGVTEAAAAKLGRAYAERLGAGDSALPARLPHLAVAAAGDRAPGSCRANVAELWPSGAPLPAVHEALRLEPANLLEFLAPDLRLDVATTGGFVLRAVRPAATSRGGACVLEFEAPPEGQQSEAVCVDVGVSPEGNEAFGAVQGLWLRPRLAGTHHGDGLPLALAGLCSWLVALFELKQSPTFSVSVPESAVRMNEALGGDARDHSAGQDADIETQRFNLLASGFTVLRQVFPQGRVEALAASVDRALEATRVAVAAGRTLPYTFYDEATYLGTRCVYCWGNECVALLDENRLQRVADAVIGPHRLFDMSALRALPSAPHAVTRTQWWHRDIDVLPHSPPNVRYLWFFVLLDDFTADNGATWVVPGSQRIPNEAIPRDRDFPTSVQLLGAAGDVIVINPSALHTVGHNVTSRPRTMINVSMCHADVPPLMDHWSIAGPTIQAKASARARQMLGADDRPPDVTWAVLPDGWMSARRPVDVPLSERKLPTEQQGYQRQHHMRDGVLMPDRPGNRDDD